MLGYHCYLLSQCILFYLRGNSFNDSLRIGDNQILQFLVNLKGNFVSHSVYRGHLTGILSIDTFYVEGVKSEMMFTALSSRCMDGNANENLANAAKFLLLF